MPAPQLIKIDVEYAEDHVLRGAMGILEKNGPVLLCEIHSTENGVNCFKILRGLGYSMKDLNTGQVWDSQDKVSRGQILAVRGR